jgi:hypothetical protein
VLIGKTEESQPQINQTCPTTFIPIIVCWLTNSSPNLGTISSGLKAYRVVETMSLVIGVSFRKAQKVGGGGAVSFNLKKIGMQHCQHISLHSIPPDSPGF